MPSERNITRALFAVGAGLIVGTLTYSILRSWPTFDPIASATLIGIGLLLVVIYERLGVISRTLQSLLSVVEQQATSERNVPAAPLPPDAKPHR